MTHNGVEDPAFFDNLEVKEKEDTDSLSEEEDFSPEKWQNW